MPDGGAGGSPLLRPGDGTGGGGLGAAFLQRGRHLHLHLHGDQEQSMNVHSLMMIDMRRPTVCRYRTSEGGRNRGETRGYKCCYALCCDIFLYTEYNFQNNFHVTMRVSCIQRTGRVSQLGSCIIYKVASHSTQAKPLYHGHSVQRESDCC